MHLEYYQMIDRIVDVDLDARRLRAACTVPMHSTIFEGHFPTYPLMPGALLLECMAQTAGWMVCVLGGFSGVPFLVGAKDAKFRTLVFPGDALEFDGNVVHEGSGYAIAESVGTRDGKKVCEAELTFRVMPFPTPQFRETFFAWGERLNFPVREYAK